MDDNWALKVTIRNHEYKIWANGEIAGFPLCGGAVVVNKIPRLIAAAADAARNARISELEAQLEAEGAHTAAANETIDRLMRSRP